MKSIEKIFNNFEKIPVSEMLKNKDPLAKKRKEFKFIFRVENLRKIADFLSDDFLCLSHISGLSFSYENYYFDTDDFFFFNKHRCGKPNRLKVRIRNYKSGDQKSFLECKMKIKGIYTEKERFLFKDSLFEIEKMDTFKDPKFQKILQNFKINRENLSQKISTSYDRIFLVSKDFKRRITFDTGLNARSQNDTEISLFKDFVIMEIKDEKTPKNIMQFLQKNLKIRQTKFSKYCISLCALNPEFKRNKWKQILKLNEEDI